MRMRISGCYNCPFKKFGENITCALNGELVLSDKKGELRDYLADKAIHPNCKLLGEKVVVTLDVRCKINDTPLEAFLGNYVRLSNGKRGVIVAKFKDSTEMDRATRINYLARFGDKRPAYCVALDGQGIATCGPDDIQEILRETAPYNFNADFEFYFGVGTDESTPE